jgi:hypothetical protein
VPPGDAFGRRRVGIGERDDLEAVVERRQLGQVRDLRHEPCADDPDSHVHGERFDHSLSAMVKDRLCPSLE